VLVFCDGAARPVRRHGLATYTALRNSLLRADLAPAPRAGRAHAAAGWRRSPCIRWSRCQPVTRRRPQRNAHRGRCTACRQHHAWIATPRPSNAVSVPPVRGAHHRRLRVPSPIFGATDPRYSLFLLHTGAADATTQTERRPQRVSAVLTGRPLILAWRLPPGRI